MKGIIRLWIGLALFLVATGCSSKESSTDQGKTSVVAATVLGDLTYQDVLQKGAVIHNLAMTDSEKIWIGTYAGLFSSSDNKLWYEVSPKLQTVDVTGWYIDPDVSTSIYLGGNNVMKQSRDGGKSWSDFNEGLPENPDIRGLIGIKKSGDLHLYAAVSGDGVYQSVDGSAWKKWMPLDQEVYAIAYHKDDDRIYVATQYGLLYATDKTWEPEQLDHVEQIYSLCIDERDGAIYVATEQGVLKKEEGEWAPLVQKAPERLVVLSQGKGDYQLVGVGESAYIYTLRNDTWTRME